MTALLGQILQDRFERSDPPNVNFGRSVSALHSRVFAPRNMHEVMGMEISGRRVLEDGDPDVRPQRVASMLARGALSHECRPACGRCHSP